MSKASTARTRAKAETSTSAGKISKGASSGFAYEAIKKKIVALELAPGCGLDELELVATLNISRTPLREALVRLAGDGLVEILPNRGARVSPMGWDDIRNHLEAFDITQRLITRWAAVRRTEANLATMEAERDAFEAAASARQSDAMIDANWRFHAAIASAGRNTVMEQFYLRLLTTNLRIARLAMAYECFDTEKAYRAHLASIVKEHREMVAAIREQDADRAEELGRSHANLARRRVSDRLTQSPDTIMSVSLAS